ncbi:MAG: D-alanine--D-alanine ligase, partial [Muribaculaceae bacterium]|nr:D-alanine--D-alanine ligase [Muribaculaceae bacterium]
MKGLVEKSEEVFMRPEYGDYNLYRANAGGGFFSKKNPVVAELHVAIPVLHGSHGEDGMFEGLLETIGIPFAGCDTLSSANGMDKITMKMILRSEDIPVVDYVWFTDKEWISDRDSIIKKIEDKLGYPVIVKPANLGSSVGIGKASDRESLIAKVDDAAKFSQRLIVEDMVEDMMEINCSVLGDCDDHQSSVCEEPISKGDFLSYEEKYGGGAKAGMQASEKRIPADIPEEMSREIQRLAGETFRVLSCHGVSRIDVMVDNKSDRIYVNEINTIPGSLSFYLWEESGISFTQLMDKLVELALRRKRETDRKTFTYDANIFAMGGGTKGGVKGKLSSRK